MPNINGNIPNLKDSKSVGKSEIQNAKQNMNSSTGQNMILGAKLTPNTSDTASGGITSDSMPNLNSSNSSTSVGSEELQNAKNKVQKSGNSKRLF